MTVFMRAAMLSAVLLASSAASAQDYPTRLIRIVLGGAPDAIARMVAEKLQAAWGQPVIVENKPAAGGTLMSQEVASAAPDGHTLMFCSSGQIMVVPFYKVSYDMVRDFAGVTQITTMPWVLAVTPFSVKGITYRFRCQTQWPSTDAENVRLFRRAISVNVWQP